MEQKVLFKTNQQRSQNKYNDNLLRKEIIQSLDLVLFQIPRHKSFYSWAIPLLFGDFCVLLGFSSCQSHPINSADCLVKFPSTLGSLCTEEEGYLHYSTFDFLSFEEIVLHFAMAEL